MTNHSGHRKRKTTGEADYEKISVQRNGKSIHLGENKFKKEEFARHISGSVREKPPSASVACNFVQPGIFVWDNQYSGVLAPGVGGWGEAAEGDYVCNFHVCDCACDRNSASGNVFSYTFRGIALCDEPHQHRHLALAVWRERRKKR